MLKCWSELLTLLGCQGFPKTRQGLAEGKFNKTQRAGRLNLQQVRFLEAHLISWNHKVGLTQKAAAHPTKGDLKRISNGICFCQQRPIEILNQHGRVTYVNQISQENIKERDKIINMNATSQP